MLDQCETTDALVVQQGFSIRVGHYKLYGSVLITKLFQ